jgi:hypothetical protein
LVTRRLGQLARAYLSAGSRRGWTGADTIPRDLRGSFASRLIFEGLNVLEVAPELGHKPSTCLDIYGRLFEEFDPAHRRPAVEVMRDARRAVRDGTVPTGYPDEGSADKRGRRATAEEGDLAGLSNRALCRTRTGDPFLTMEVLYQLS